jgi:S-adenosylmethionine hydrolase
MDVITPDAVGQAMITLASDFGSPYPAAMKAVILRDTDARLVDVAHDLPRQDVRAAAFWLREVLPYFPPAVHLAVIDPGVGTDRAAVVVRAGDHRLVGPDNGVLLPAARRLAAGSPYVDADDAAAAVEVCEWTYDDPDSSTFHGRDVFAPAAAAVHETEAVTALDAVRPGHDHVDLTLPAPDLHEDGAIGEVLAIDGFGNVVTNVPGDVLDGRREVAVDDRPVPVENSYAGVDAGQWLATVGSHGNVELAVNGGRGDEAFGLSARDDVVLEW